MEFHTHAHTHTHFLVKHTHSRAARRTMNRQLGVAHCGRSTSGCKKQCSQVELHCHDHVMMRGCHLTGERGARALWVARRGRKLRTQVLVRVLDSFQSCVQAAHAPTATTRGTN